MAEQIKDRIKEELEFTVNIGVSELFFVGRATSKKLFAVGIKAIGELSTADPVWLKKSYMEDLSGSPRCLMKLIMTG